jgi:hypothetical protein
MNIPNCLMPDFLVVAEEVECLRKVIRAQSAAIAAWQDYATASTAKYQLSPRATQDERWTTTDRLYRADICMKDATVSLATIKAEVQARGISTE